MAGDLDELARVLRQSLWRKVAGRNDVAAVGESVSEAESMRRSRDCLGAVFRDLDANSNGLLDRGALTTAMQQLGMELTHAEADQLIRRCSGGSEDTISLVEFVAFVIGSAREELSQVVCTEERMVPKRRPLSAQYAGFHKRPKEVVPHAALTSLVEAHAPP
jgi:hypothetical protein